MGWVFDRDVKRCYDVGPFLNPGWIIGVGAGHIVLGGSIRTALAEHSKPQSGNLICMLFVATVCHKFEIALFGNPTSFLPLSQTCCLLLLQESDST